MWLYASAFSNIMNVPWHWLPTPLIYCGAIVNWLLWVSIKNRDCEFKSRTSSRPWFINDPFQHGLYGNVVLMDNKTLACHTFSTTMCTCWPRHGNLTVFSLKTRHIWLLLPDVLLTHRWGQIAECYCNDDPFSIFFPSPNFSIFI